MSVACGLTPQRATDRPRNIQLFRSKPSKLAKVQPEISFSPVGNNGVYWRAAAAQVKREIGVPLMLVGGIRSCKTAEILVEDGVADYVSLCRPLIREPDLVRCWQVGDKKVADCISDNACMMAGVQGKGVHCPHLGS